MGSIITMNGGSRVGVENRRVFVYSLLDPTKKSRTVAYTWTKQGKVQRGQIVRSP